MNNKFLTLSTNALLLAFTAWANASTIAVSISGTVMAPPSCVVNNNTDVSVKFGDDILTTQIDGVAYKLVAVPLSVTCTNLTDTTMSFKIGGTAAAFDSNLLKTSNNDLGIQFKVDGNNIPLGSNNNFIYSAVNPPTISAVLAKNSSATLSAGAFTASATITFAYQ